MFLHHFLVLINQDGPVTMQIVWVLQKHFVCPLFCLCNQKVDKCRLIISFKVGSSFQSLWEQFTCSKKCGQIMSEKQGAAKMSLCHHYNKPSHWQIFKGDNLQLAYEPNTNLHGALPPTVNALPREKHRLSNTDLMTYNMCYKNSSRST